ncbi:vacuolar protein sorting/targeting protein PEP1 [Phlyctochytrium bullatum]|nr:vacuolar protein sorting/targeting protein PEP1 [Phlyctochytrium bullatum]
MRAVILLLESGRDRVHRSDDEGKSWTKLKEMEDVKMVIPHPFAKDSRAFALTSGKTHYWTKDKGKSWTKFTTELPPSFDIQNGPLSFNAEELDWVIYKGQKCEKDGWLELYVKKETVLCNQWPSNDDDIIKSPEKVKLVRTTNYFEKDTETIDVGGGALGLGVVQKYLVLAVKPRKADRIDMYISLDGSTFTMAQLPGDFSLAEESYTVLDSSDHRLTIDVLPNSASKKLNRAGNLFFSNSNGTYFIHSLTNTNRDLYGRVDFERIQVSRFSGMILANVVTNPQEQKEDKKLATMLSMDDGARWSLLRPPQKDADGNDWKCKVSDKGTKDCALHLHSVTTAPNIGRVFSTNAAPGLLMGVGSVGPYLLPWDSCHTFLSSDGGKTWITTASGPHMYETGDMGSIVVLVPSNGPTDYIMYSTKRGASSSYKKVEVKPKGVKKWKARLTDIDPDSTSSKMIVFLTDAEDVSKNFVAHIDLSGAQSRQCESGDFEEWSPQVDGKPECVMGEKLFFKRRKPDADCYVGRKYKEPDVKTETCECTEADYECDFNFKPKDSEAKEALVCEQIGPVSGQPANCKKGEKYKGSSGYKRIPGNKCKGGKNLEDSITRECQDDDKKADGKPTVSEKSFEDGVDRAIYMRKSSTMFFLTDGGVVWRSDDEGMSWNEPEGLKDKKPVKLVGLHDTDDKRVYLFTENDIYYSLDGKTDSSSLKKLETPVKYNLLGLPIIDFHPTEPDYVVFVGGARGCPKLDECFTEVYLTLDNGKSWLNDKKPVETWATKCVWAQDVGFAGNSKLDKDAVYCASYKYKNGKVPQDEMGGRGTDDNPLQLVLITNGGKNRRVLIDSGVVTFYVVESFLTVAVGFTVLESTTGAIFMDAVQNANYNREVGQLFKSNSNGTFFSKVLKDSNRNDRGQVDLEKVLGVPGIVMVNQVLNPKDVASGSSKRVRSLISFDDGARWMKITPPKKDSEGNEFNCSGECVLNLYRKTSSGQQGLGRPSVASSPAAAGLIIGIGNVGPYLRSVEQCDMFASLDAGRTWREIHKNPHKWVIGDHGGLIVMASEKGPTDSILYTFNYGKTWSTFQFAKSPVIVHSMWTQPDSTSLKFIILGISEDKKQDLQLTAYGVNFENALPRKCDKPSPSSSDYVQWSPLDEDNSDRCFLGKKEKFLRRKEDAKCLIGKEFEYFKEEVKSCSCEQEDFECDINFWFDDETKECVLLGVDPLQPANCKNGTKYEGSSGYRKISLSSCKGGVNLEKKVERICGEVPLGPGDVKVVANKFKEKLDDYFYFNRTKTAVILDESGQVWISKDAGEKWERPDIMKDSKIVRIMPDPFRGSRAFFFTNEKKHFRTDNNGEKFSSFETPVSPNTFGADLFSIHPDNDRYFIYTGQEECEKDQANCRAVSYVSTDGASSWREMKKYVTRCIWARDKYFKALNEEIICKSYKVDSGNQRHMSRKDHPILSVSKDQGKNWDVLFEDVVGFAISYEYMVAAVGNPENSDLHLKVTTDGINWKQAEFQDGKKITEVGYTLLDSGTGAIFLEVFTSRTQNEEYGTLYKSNAAGLDFEVVQKNLNQDHVGFVDFEKMLGIDGIAIANTVANTADVHVTKSKKIQTFITFNDGARWQRLNAPEGEDCNGDDCNLNLHHFTERRDKNDLFSTKAAIGVMAGVGNVGKYLSKYTDGDVFITRDAGKTWKKVTTDAHMIEIGDRGGVIVMVFDEGSTDEIKYTLDQGNTVRSIRINDKLDGGSFKVTNIISEPYGSSSTFVVFGTIKGGNSDGSTIAVYLDFEKVWPENCKFNKDQVDTSDFEKNYYRRKANRHCRIGDFLEGPQVQSVSCLCTIDDFECDTGYLKNATGGCEWGDPKTPKPDPVCKNGAKQYSTGYRKHRKTKCQGGLALDRDVPAYCASPISALGWFGIILVSIGIPAGISYGIIWHYRGGRIRLPVDAGQAATPPRHWAERVGFALRSTLVAATEMAEIVASKCRAFYDWIRNKANRHAGYSPVRNVATAIDEEIDNDPSLLDLDDY